MTNLENIIKALQYIVLIGGSLRILILLIQVKVELGNGGDIFPIKKRISNTIIFIILAELILSIKDIVGVYYK